MTRENDYQLEQAASAQQAAATLGVEVQLLFAENDAIIQGAQVLKVIQSNPTLRPDAILCQPVGGPCLPQVARAAATAGIPWAILNRDADYIGELRRSSGLPIFRSVWIRRKLDEYKANNWRCWSKRAEEECCTSKGRRKMRRRRTAQRECT